MRTLVRLSFMFVAVVACAAAAVVAYAALGNALALGRVMPVDWGSPVSDTSQRETFTVQPGQSATAVAEELQRRGLIRSSLVFRWEIQSRGLGSKLEAGDYELSPGMSTKEIVTVLARGAVAPGTTLTVLEGWRAHQIAQRAEQLGLAEAEVLLRLVQSPREHGLNPPDPAAQTLEGYLFPDTYQFDPKVTPNEIVVAMLRQFDRRFDADLRRQAAARGLTVSQAVTLASIIEREAAQPSERPLIASVFHNRLAAGMNLDADPTVQYAAAGRDLRAAASYGFWKRDLTVDDLKIESAYNTYRVDGLPPGPICSPGLDSLQAAVVPAETRFLYFVARGDGSHAFAETSHEHQANVQRFRSQ
jgi:UPF0755 protein